MEKHTIQDGTIPLSGLSPLVVCRQWITNAFVNKTNAVYPLPLTMSEIFTATMSWENGGKIVNPSSFATVTSVNTAGIGMMTNGSSPGVATTYVIAIGKA